MLSPPSSELAFSVRCGGTGKETTGFFNLKCAEILSKYLQTGQMGKAVTPPPPLQGQYANQLSSDLL